LAGIPLTEAELLSICHAPPDSPSRERGLTLKRTRKLANRKAMESNVGAKKMNRASTVSVMSGLGVPTGTRTRSTPSARSPSAGSFLNRGRKMYNFFGHRPPSELISNHLADYFPYVQKKVLERTARNSMLR
ncbi:hypothetical protein BDY24DRAFT_327294, partial [Mrakia frigida]|uniref:uncharacterized protein n=1 Tax=Mrakia frigida TaxID=29902 RepID=UPI003FCC270A